jgi:hypothetical protein
MKTIDEVYVYDGYAADTLINGNISECIRYISEFMNLGAAGIGIAVDELIKVKELCPEKYDFVKEAAEKKAQEQEWAQEREERTKYGR